MMARRTFSVFVMSDAAFSDEPSLPARPAVLTLLPFEPAPGEAPRWSEAEFVATPAPTHPAKRWRGAASLAAVVLIGAAAAVAEVHAARVASAEQAATRALAHRLDAIAASLQSLDANRPDLTGLKKSLADLKANAASAHELGGAVTQLTARVDRLEKDQTGKLDKLEKDSTQQLASIAQRLDKLEAKPAPKAEPAKPAPAASMEPTGSIEKPKAPLRHLYLSEIHNGYAMIDSPQGEFAVAPGDMVPGGGRVLRIERHGRDWVVVTTLGEIAAAAD